jgi:para-nitrobenzyl esterase
MEPIASTIAGKICGRRVDNGSEVLEFRGIPYAAPPLGAHRFRPPVPPDPWDGVRDALAFGPTAPQKDPAFTIIPEPVERGDDFLNLNVSTPSLGADAKLPVFVWIHGGGFVSGCNRSPWYRGLAFARDGIVLVTISYRLGVEGFLEIEGAPSNRAVLDWIFALEWVRDNIASFGGDPDQVTIGGQSAGSAAALITMVNPRAKGLFRRVVAMSGTSDSRMPRDSALRLANDLAAHLGVRPTVEEFSRFDPYDLVDAHAALGGNPFSGDSLTKGFDPKAPALRPFADGETIPERPFRAIGSGAARDVPLLAGSTTQELNGMVQMQRANLADRADEVLASMGLDDAAVARYRQQVGSDDAIDVLAQVATDRAFREPLSRLLDDHASAGGTTFGYQFGWRSPLFDGMVGSAHCLDIPFAFDDLDAQQVADGLHGPDAPQALADEMHSAWVSFIQTGDAGWKRYGTTERISMSFDTESSVVPDQLALQREVLGSAGGRR